MEKKNNATSLVKKAFWCFNLPSLGAVSIYCIVNQQRALESLLFCMVAVLCMPYLFIKVEEYRKKAIDKCQDEFSDLTDDELVDLYKKADDAPSSPQKFMYMEALKKELRKRC